MTQTLATAALNPLAMAIAAWLWLSGCTDQSANLPATSDTETSDQSPGPGNSDTTRPGGGPPPRPGGGGGPSRERPQAIPASVPSENPSNEAQGSLALASLGSARLEKRFASGLSLERREMCKELGTENCFGQVFSPALGRNKPQSRVTAPVNPPALAPVAIERIARQVCRLRRQKDAALGNKAEVFKFFDLGLGEPSAEAVAKQTAFLYDRLLSRAPSQAELAATEVVLGQGMSGGDIAETLCFAVAGSMEILFN